MEPGTRIEVRSQFDQSWSSGFEVAETVGPEDDPERRTFRVRRLSDGMILPRMFPADEVRRERRRSTWWI